MSTATWKCVAKHNDLKRSSHIISTINQRAFVFGGELISREPRDNKIFDVDIKSQGKPRVCLTNTAANKARPETAVRVLSSANAPIPRVGSASATLNNKLYLFSGRGGTAMAPIDEQGAIWQFNPATEAWTLLVCEDPSAPIPPARSYHSLTSNGVDTLYLHAGCPEKGRLSDLWAFNVNDHRWQQLPDAPAPARGGTNIAYSNSRVFRMNGFDGKTEQGGSLDIFDANNKAWSTITYAADGETGPEARSVAALLPLKLNGRSTLITLFGERDPSSLGHAGAGKMLGDFWLYDICKCLEKQRLLPHSDNDIDADSWSKGHSLSHVSPAPRGWFGADVIGESSIVISGGLNEDNERLDDIWVLTF